MLRDILKFLLLITIFICTILIVEGVKCGKCYKSVFGVEQEGIKNLDARIMELVTSSIIKMNNIDQVTEFRKTIPLITHHIYFTSKENSRAITEQEKNIVIKSLSALNNQQSGWHHYFWTNDESIVPREIREIEGVVTKNIDEFKDDILYQNLLNSLQQARESKGYYALASNIFRFMAVYEYGGIYMDVDYRIYDAKRLMKFVKAYDFLDGLVEINKCGSGKCFVVNSSFIAAKKNHKILEYSLSLINRNLNKKEKPPYINVPCTNLDKITNNGSVVIAASIYKYADSSVDILFPARILYNFYERDMPANQPVAKIYNNIPYIELPIANDSFGGTWIDQKDKGRICHSRF